MTFLLLETIHPEAQARLASVGRVVLADQASEAEQVVREEPVHAILTRGRGQVQRPFLAQCPSLKVVARVGVGLDNIDVDAATEQGVMVINAPGSTTVAAAEHTWLLMTALVRGLVPMVQAVKDGNWAYRKTYQGDELSDKTLGIIGMGAIGQRVAKLAEVFGMTVVYWNRSPKDMPYPLRTLPALLEEADIVSINIALTPDTRNLLGNEELAMMKPGALLVNTARGEIIDQTAVVEALSSGHLGGFAADVLSTEPADVNDPLLKFDNVILTPHAAALTETTYRKMSLRTVENVIAALQGLPIEPGCLVNG